MGTFGCHSDIHELEGVRGPDGLAAIGLYILSGTWTAANGRTGVVPEHVVRETFSGDQETVDRLIGADLWEACDGGYQMLRGPHPDPDAPLRSGGTATTTSEVVSSSWTPRRTTDRRH